MKWESCWVGLNYNQIDGQSWHITMIWSRTSNQLHAMSIKPCHNYSVYALGFSKIIFLYVPGISEMSTQIVMWIHRTRNKSVEFLGLSVWWKIGHYDLTMGYDIVTVKENWHEDDVISL